MPAVVVIIIILLLIGLVIKFWPLALAIVLIWVSVLVIREIRKNRYFASEEFLAHKSALESVISEHNAISNYASEMRDSGAFDLGLSSTGRDAHLATFVNTSEHNYRRDRNLANYQSGHIHNSSLQVVRNASGNPIKYLMKYFDIKPKEENLADAERLGNDIARLEGAIENLNRREASITQSINPPAFILKHYADQFNRQVGVEL